MFVWSKNFQCFSIKKIYTSHKLCAFPFNDLELATMIMGQYCFSIRKICTGPIAKTDGQTEKLIPICPKNFTRSSYIEKECNSKRGNHHGKLKIFWDNLPKLFSPWRGFILYNSIYICWNSRLFSRKIVEYA